MLVKWCGLICDAILRLWPVAILYKKRHSKPSLAYCKSGGDCSEFFYTQTPLPARRVAFLSVLVGISFTASLSVVISGTALGHNVILTNRLPKQLQQLQEEVTRSFETPADAIRSLQSPVTSLAVFTGGDNGTNQSLYQPDSQSNATIGIHSASHPRYHIAPCQRRVTRHPMSAGSSSR